MAPHVQGLTSGGCRESRRFQSARSQSPLRWWPCSHGQTHSCKTCGSQGRHQPREAARKALLTTAKAQRRRKVYPFGIAKMPVPGDRPRMHGQEEETLQPTLQVRNGKRETGGPFAARAVRCEPVAPGGPCDQCQVPGMPHSADPTTSPVSCTLPVGFVPSSHMVSTTAITWASQAKA